MSFQLTIVILTLIHIPSSFSAPIADNRQQRQAPGLNFRFNPDGSVSGSISSSNAFHNPGVDGAFGISETFNIGPNGSSFSGGQTGSVIGRLPGGNNFNINLSNTNANSAGLNGFSNSGANSFSNNFSNPFYSNANANANAFANSAKFNNPFG